MRILKFIAGGLGFAMGGPIGALLGLGAGYLLEELNRPDAIANKTRSADAGTRRGDFTMSFLVLVAAVMKADGKVMRSELDYVKAQLVKMFGPQGAKDSTRILGDLLKQHIPTRDVAQQIRRNMDYSSRLEMVHLLFGIAGADGNVSNIEVDTIQVIASGMGISTNDWNAIKAMFVSDREWPYKVLDIQPSASDDDVKKAYRKMAIKFHPDKVAHLGEDYQERAKEKFQKVNQAYEELKKVRNLN